MIERGEGDDPFALESKHLRRVREWTLDTVAACGGGRGLETGADDGVRLLQLITAKARPSVSGVISREWVVIQRRFF